jgi:hypothetical protein
MTAKNFERHVEPYGVAPGLGARRPHVASLTPLVESVRIEATSVAKSVGRVAFAAACGIAPFTLRVALEGKPIKAETHGAIAAGLMKTREPPDVSVVAVLGAPPARELPINIANVSSCDGCPFAYPPLTLDDRYCSLDSAITWRPSQTIAVPVPPECPLRREHVLVRLHGRVA